MQSKQGSQSADSNVMAGTAAPRAGRVYPAEKWLWRKLLSAFGAPAIRVVLWDGEEIVPAIPPAATLRVRDRRTWFALMRNPDLNFGDAYRDGRIEVEGDLVGLLEAVYLSEPYGSLASKCGAWMAAARLGGNSLTDARSNIHHHYDLGNDFYRLWLDERLQYTCAYFPSPATALEEAQIAKMEHVCRKVRLEPGDHVVEAGCGWGEFALFMAERHGATVRAFNISAQQIAYAREQALRRGLTDRVEFIEDDYRNISGSYDVFVSVGMLEHVGKSHYRELGRVIDACLGSRGRGLVHTIGRNRPMPLNAWIERRIFPGAYPPTLREMMEIFEPFDLSVLDVENLRLHYARTLEHWLQRFELSAGRIASLFDASFVRAWRLYLAGSMIAFRTSWLQLFQVSFARARDNAMPWTRAHLYAP